MITFEQVTEIETKRRQIEQLQELISKHALASHFAIGDGSNHSSRWNPIPIEYEPILREALCKVTVVKIIKLLDESERLGVNVTKPKEAILAFLEGIKAQEAQDADHLT